MNYLIVNPYGPAYGITSYSRNLAGILSDRVSVDLIENDVGMSWKGFRHRVADHVVRRYTPSNVIIEAPETRSATLLVPEEYPRHIRMHSGGGIGELGNGWPVDIDRLETELGVIRGATVLSSSSYAAVSQMGGLVDTTPAHVFKNPPDRSVRFVEADRKAFDLFFMGRLERLKGCDWLDPLLERMPASFHAKLVGPGVEDYARPDAAECRIDAAPAIFDRSRFDLLGRARVFLMLSRFENCSLAILEALAAGTVVVGWDAGGNAEIAPPSVMRLVPLGDVDALAESVRAACESAYPTRSTFREATEALRADFEAGWTRVWNPLTTGDSLPRFEGLNHRTLHVSADPRLEGGPSLVGLDEAYAEATAHRDS